MAGFQDKKIKRNRTMATEEEEEKDIDYGEEEDEETSSHSKGVGSSLFGTKQNKVQPKVFLIAIGVVVFLVAGFVGFSVLGNSAKNNTPEDTPLVEQQEPEIQPNQTSPATQEPVEEKKEQEPSVAPFNEDMPTNPETPVWAMASVAMVKDFCNYEKKRSVTGNGLELYWLDCVYKEMPYVIQVKYETYNLLDSKGIVPIIGEKVITTDGVEIITYMSVDTDYLKRMNK